MSFKPCVELVDAMQVELRQDEIRLGVPVEDQILFETWLNSLASQAPRIAWERRIAAEALARASYALGIHGCEEDPTSPGGMEPKGTEH
jgi:hypothetical protein